MTTENGLFVTCPSRTLTTIASMNTTGYTRSRGRCCHSDISAVTFSVIRLIVSLPIEAP